MIITTRSALQSESTPYSEKTKTQKPTETIQSNKLYPDIEKSILDIAKRVFANDSTLKEDLSTYPKLFELAKKLKNASFFNSKTSPQDEIFEKFYCKVAPIYAEASTLKKKCRELDKILEPLANAINKHKSILYSLQLFKTSLKKIAPFLTYMDLSNYPFEQERWTAQEIHELIASAGSRLIELDISNCNLLQTLPENLPHLSVLRCYSTKIKIPGSYSELLSVYRD